MMLAPMLAASAALAQDAPEAPPLPAVPALRDGVEWVDETIAVVHDRIFTLSDLQILRARAMRDPTFAERDEAEREDLARQLVDERVDQLLQIQACRDAGFDPVRIEDLVDRLFDDYVHNRGGPAATAELLSEAGLTPSDVRADIYDRMLAATWSEMVTGEAPGITGRPERDRFVRPGQLRAVYGIEQRQKDARWMQLLGGEPERVVLQQLVLPVDHRGTEAAVRQAADIRAEAVDGADFDQLVRTWSVSPQDNGIAKPHPVQRLALLGRDRHGDDRLGRFVREAEPGAISEPMGSVAPSPDSASAAAQRPMVYLYRLVERQPARVPPFDTIETQRALREEIQRLTDQRRLDAAKRKLREALLERLNAPAQPEAEAEPAADPTTGG